MKWWLLAALTVLPSEVAARYIDDYEGGDAGSILLLFIPVCIYSGYLLCAETKSLEQAMRGAVAIAIMLGITALLGTLLLLEIVAGATALAGLVGLLHRKPN